MRSSPGACGYLRGSKCQYDLVGWSAKLIEIMTSRVTRPFVSCPDDAAQPPMFSACSRRASAPSLDSFNHLPDMIISVEP